MIGKSFILHPVPFGGMWMFKLQEHCTSEDLSFFFFETVIHKMQKLMCFQVCVMATDKMNWIS